MLRPSKPAQLLLLLWLCCCGGALWALPKEAVNVRTYGEGNGIFRSGEMRCTLAVAQRTWLSHLGYRGWHLKSDMAVDKSRRVLLFQRNDRVLTLLLWEKSEFVTGFTCGESPANATPPPRNNPASASPEQRR